MSDARIEDLIADSLRDLDERSGRGGGVRPLAHGSHILDQYAALCREDPVEPGGTTNVALPIARPRAPSGSARSNLATVARRVLARVKAR